ncbi:copper resistance CopC family protein [Gottfriedia acidiceleris]|uniref:copper resistance CopC family protein n=1 Tax=Gottfriedia acidiceleris TaxID=371036 RepID=UPI003D1A8D83
MKKALLFIMLLLFIFPSLASAHTTLESSNPSDGQVISEPLKQITLNFETPLEKLSTLKVFQDGKDLEVKDISIENNRMVANLPKDLENGNYEIEWKIVGEDGHPITGDVEFKVQLKQEENKVTTNNDKTLDKSSEGKEKNTQEAKEVTPKEEKKKIPYALIGIGVFGILLLVGGVIVWNKK